jgi:hypothetical protein
VTGAISAALAENRMWRRHVDVHMSVKRTLCTIATDWTADVAFVVTNAIEPPGPFNSFEDILETIICVVH